MKPDVMEKESYTVAILGATGLVGRAMLKTLERRNFPITGIRLLATEKSAGETLEYNGSKIRVEAASPESFDNVDISLFSAGSDASLQYTEIAVDRGSFVIDNSSAYRMSDDVPLVVPEVNSESIWENRGIISNPNCSTIQLVVALKPLVKLGIERVYVSTYQSVSGMGQKGIDRLLSETNTTLNNDAENRDGDDIPYAFNAVPKCDNFLENGYTREEMKLLLESRKILGTPDLKMSVTAVRVPVMYGHSESVTIKFRDEVTADQVRAILSDSPGVVVMDDPDRDVFPHPKFAEGSGDTFVGRIRQDLDDPTIVMMFVVADNVLKGAAWNAVQIAELLTASRPKTARL